MEIESGVYGVGGNNTATVRIDFYGMLGDGFARFIQRRAARLSLAGSWDTEPGHLAVILTGSLPLIDAFEMACILGPIDASIVAWDRTDIGGAAPLLGRLLGSGAAA